MPICKRNRILGWWQINQSTIFFFFSSRRRHTRCRRDWSSDVCSSDLGSLGSVSDFPDRDLNSEDLSAKSETEPREPERDLARPLVSEAARDSDPDRDLYSELFSPRVEVEQIGRASCRERREIA